MMLLKINHVDLNVVSGKLSSLEKTLLITSSLLLMHRQKNKPWSTMNNQGNKVTQKENEIFNPVENHKATEIINNTPL